MPPRERLPTLMTGRSSVTTRCPLSKRRLRCVAAAAAPVPPGQPPHRRCGDTHEDCCEQHRCAAECQRSHPLDQTVLLGERGELHRQPVCVDIGELERQVHENERLGGQRLAQLDGRLGSRRSGQDMLGVCDARRVERGKQCGAGDPGVLVAHDADGAGAEVAPHQSAGLGHHAVAEEDFRDGLRPAHRVGDHVGRAHDGCRAPCQLIVMSPPTVPFAG